MYGQGTQPLCDDPRTEAGGVAALQVAGGRGLLVAVNAPFMALRIHDAAGGCRLDRVTLDELSPGEVVVRVEWSSVNYKDALAATGGAPIVSGFPRVGGIDLAGRVVHSAHPDWPEGTAVLANGCGLGERHDGGYAEYARLPADDLVPMPDALDARRAMALGTAGFTVALCLKRLQDNGQHPGQGPIAVTGATGGVGSLAVSLLAGLGYEVHAVTGKDGAAEYLRGLGARAVHDRRRLEMGARPLERTRWAGAIDNLGGAMLAWLTRTVEPWGNIVSVGLAGGSALHTTVMPFILRGVSLLGVSSANCPMTLRRELWQRLADAWAPAGLERIAAREVTFRELPGVFAQCIDGGITGRVLVRCRSPSA